MCILSKDLSRKEHERKVHMTVVIDVEYQIYRLYDLHPTYQFEKLTCIHQL